MLLEKEKILQHEVEWSSNVYYTISTFNDLELKAIWNIAGPAFSLFPTMFSTLPETNLNFSVTLNLSYANALNLDQSKICCLVKS